MFWNSLELSILKRARTIAFYYGSGVGTYCTSSTWHMVKIMIGPFKVSSVT